MRSKFTLYSVIVALICTLASWSGLARRATGGQGTGNSWHSGGAGYSGGGFAGSSGGGHK